MGGEDTVTYTAAGHRDRAANADDYGVFLAADDLAPHECETPWWLTDDFYPGDGADEASWRAGLPDDVRSDYDSGAYTGDGEAFGPGFTHHDQDGPTGAGFAAGGALDGLEPGAFLAEMLAAATAASDSTDGYTQLGESELIGVLCAWRRMSSWSAAGEAAAVSTLACRRAVQALRRENRHLDEHAGDEIAAALALTGQSAQRLMEIAYGLKRLPDVYAALLTGQIDWAKACVFVDELAALDEAEARRLAALLLGLADRLTTSQLRRRLRLLVLDSDPEAYESRKRTARKDTRVEVWDEPSGNAALAGRELQSADVIAIDKQLTATAEWLQSQGADGTIAELRSAAYTALLAGRDLSTLLPDPSDTDSRDETDSRDGTDLPCTDMPGGEARGSGARDSHARDRHVRGGSTSHGRTSHGSASTGAVGAARGRADATSAGWPRLTGRINLTMPLSTWAGLSDNAGEAAGYRPQDAGTCRDLADMTDTRTRWCLTLTDENGRAVAHACARRGPPRSEPAIRWAKGLRSKLEYLETGSCSHARQSSAYRPPNRLAHLVRIRQPTCSFLGCRRQAARCDLDHTTPYDNGGRTCECNLGPLCRRHHRAKQAARWHLTQDQPGVMTWRLPSGRIYTTSAEPYPG